MNDNLKYPPLILIVDDDTDMRRVMELTLQSRGWRVDQAANGANALVKINASKPDLIVIDLMMPGMSGTEFCKRLINDMKMDDLPVLLISAANDKSAVVRDFINLPLKHKDFLKKPFQPDELLNNVEAVFRQSGLQFPADHPVSQKPPTTDQDFNPELKSEISGGKLDTPQNQGYRILIIDDEPDIRKLLETTLGIFHTCETAENGMVGLQKLDEFAPDFILSDINMPVMDGFETAAAIRRHPYMQHIPIFFLTGVSDKNLPKKAYDVGGNLYLRKPVNPIQLMKFTDHFISESRIEAGGNLRLMKQRSKIGGISSRTVGAQPTVVSHKSAPQAEKPRILFVEADASRLKQLKDIVEKHKNGIDNASETEVIWTGDTKAVIGNITRWEPDIVFYDTENPGYDGIAFTQMLKLNKQFNKIDMAFMGVEFNQADINYSQDNFQRDIIMLTSPVSQIERQIAELITKVRGNARSKKFTIVSINSEENQRLREIADIQRKEDLQRESFIRRYEDLQKYIDTNL